MDALAEVRAVEPGEAEFARGVLECGLETWASMRREVVACDDLAASELDGVGDEVCNGLFGSFKLVGSGKVLDEVGEGEDVAGMEFSRTGVSDAVEGFDRRGEGRKRLW